jgi:hypothetical protein
MAQRKGLLLHPFQLYSNSSPFQDVLNPLIHLGYSFLFPIPRSDWLILSSVICFFLYISITSHFHNGVLLPWRWRQYVLPKRWYQCTIPHWALTKKTAVWTSIQNSFITFYNIIFIHKEMFLKLWKQYDLHVRQTRAFQTICSLPIKYLSSNNDQLTWHLIYFCNVDVFIPAKREGGEEEEEACGTISRFWYCKTLRVTPVTWRNWKVSILNSHHIALPGVAAEMNALESMYDCRRFASVVREVRIRNAYF